MTLVSWNPVREFEDFFNRYNGLPARRLGPSDDADTTSSVDWRPAANISETENEYLIKAELPEVAKKDIEVTVRDGVVTISGERRFEKAADGEKQHRIESFYGRFSRSFSLPEDVAGDQIEAESKDGVLTVRLPKVEIAKPQQIEIKVK